MKIAKLYFTREDVAEKLGVDPTQIAFVGTSENLTEVEVSVLIEDTVELHNIVASDISNHWDAKRYPLFIK